MSRRPNPRATRLVGNASGATAVEFALVLPVLLVFLLGFMDYGYWMYIRSTASGALENVARGAGVGGGGGGPPRPPHPGGDVKSYYQFSGIGKPEKLVTDVNGNGLYDAGDCWLDSKPNGVFDTDSGNPGIGGADDIMLYKLTVTFPPLVPIAGFMPWLAGNHSTVVSTVVRRQPYAAQPTPSIRC